MFSSPKTETPTGEPFQHRPWRTYALGAILLCVALGWVLFHRQVGEYVGAALLLRSASPGQEEFQQIVGGFQDPTPFLERCWATAKVPHRQLVAAYLRDEAVLNSPWFAHARKLVLAGAVDPDLSVREAALATLKSRSDPALFDSARAQLRDCDPSVRQLGLDYLRRFPPQQALSVVIGLLDDPDLQIAAGAEVALMHWTREDFGVRVLIAVPEHDAAHQLDPARVETIRQGVARRKQWWQAHSKEFAEPPPEQRSALAATAHFPEPPVADFALSDLDGKTVRLWDYRGKTVLINFWATWCTACLTEIPDLIALRKSLGGQVIILGISLDSPQDQVSPKPGERNSGASRKSVLNKVARAVTARGINYPVLLDLNNEIGRRFRGGELPTTLIIDPQGRLRRRFIGTRSLQVFQAMLSNSQ